MKQLHSLIIVLLLLSACRATHTVSRMQEATLSSDSTRTRVDSFCTLTDILNHYALQADSLIVWVQSGSSFSETELQDQPGPTLQTGCAPTGKTRVPRNAKVKVCGLRLEAEAHRQSNSSALSTDSVSSLSKSASSTEVKEKEVKKSSCLREYVLFFIFMILLGIVIKKFVWHK